MRLCPTLASVLIFDIIFKNLAINSATSHFVRNQIKFKLILSNKRQDQQIQSVNKRIANYTSDKELINYNHMFEDNPFADQVNPYQHLEMYEEVCWLQNMAQLSQQVHAQMQPSTINIFLNQSISLHADHESLEFEPFELERSTLRTARRSLQEQDQETVAPSNFVEEDHAYVNRSDSNGLGFQQRQEQMQVQPKAKKSSSSISFNTTDYIIKHCFKKMLEEDFREEVEAHCEGNHLSYPAFSAFWKQVLKRYAPNKHIGLTRFIKLIGEAHPAALVCRLFFASYLMLEYPRYIAVGSMHNKQEYLRCATKLMYISYPPKMGSKNIQSARKL